MNFKNRLGMILISSVTVSSLLLTGCSTTDMKAMVSQGNAVSTTNAHLNPTNPSRVKLYYSNMGLPKHFKVVGRLSAENYSMVGMEYSQASIAEELKKQAASVGANGVINISAGLAQTVGDAIITK